jgi:hypothetical protein
MLVLNRLAAIPLYFWILIYLSMKPARTICIAFLGMLLSQASFGQSQEKVYSLFLMNFVKGINWSEVKTRTFTIDILSYPPLLSELSTVSYATTINGKKVEVRLINDLSESRGQVLFIPAFKAKLIPQALSGNALVVSNSPNVARKGGAYNFIHANGKVGYEINVKSIESRGMKVSSSLKNFGTVVESVE